MKFDPPVRQRGVKYKSSIKGRIYAEYGLEEYIYWIGDKVIDCVIE